MQKSGIRLLASVFASALLIASTAYSAAPSPTPQKQDTATAKKAQEQALLEREKEQLTRVQDRLAAKYGTGQSGKHRGEQTKIKNMPSGAGAPPNSVGPTPQNPQSGEAHSASVK